MTYEEALRALFALRRFGVRPGTGPIEAALAHLGNPERSFQAIHIAGTNGKGSTAAICEAILRADGRHVGLYTSPHLCRFTERIRISGQELAPEQAASLVEEALQAGPALTFFELVTATAFAAFALAGVDVAVVEVGLGGRLDATNVLAWPRVSVITNIALDHMEILGETTAAIAREKAGILRRGVPGVIGTVDASARAAITAIAAEVGAPLSWLGTDFLAEVSIPQLPGEHQRNNAAVALAALQRLPESLRPSDASIARGLASVRWPGRLELLADDLLVDGAHNPDGAAALAAALPAIAAGRPIHLVLGVVEEKDVLALAQPLMRLAKRIIATTVPSTRARPAAVLARALHDTWSGVEVIEDPHAAVAAARMPGALTVVAGSLFLVGAVRAQCLGETVDPIAVQDPAPRRERENL